MAKKKNVVKSAKSTTGLLLILMIAAGWALSAYTIFMDTDSAKQKAIIDSAQELLEDKLYVRAVGRYKEALSTYDTDMNLTYETELLKIYKDAGMWSDYYKLINQRIKKGTASEEEYRNLAQNYIETGSTKKAMEVLTQGMNNLDENGLSAIYETICYEYSPASTNYTQVLMPSSDWSIPAYDGEKWGYINTKGRIEMDFAYEEVTCFDGNYAVAKIDGVYTLIDKNGYWNAVDKNGLDQVTSLVDGMLVGIKDNRYGIYTNTFSKLGEDTYDNVCLSDNGLILVKKDGKWAVLDENLKHITDYVFTDVAVNSRGQVFASGYGVVADETGYFLINEKGEACFDQRFSDAKGIEGGMYAVADQSGQWGFADETGEIVIACQYQDVYSFSSRLAAAQYAGKWGYISGDGNWAIEPQFSMAYPFLGSSGLVVDELGKYRILSLKYYDMF